MGKCNKCRFAAQDDEGAAWLRCHRVPPTVVMLPDGNVHFPFPAVAPTSWCGAFRLAWKRPRPREDRS